MKKDLVDKYLSSVGKKAEMRIGGKTIGEVLLGGWDSSTAIDSGSVTTRITGSGAVSIDPGHWSANTISIGPNFVPNVNSVFNCNIGDKRVEFNEEGLRVFNADGEVVIEVDSENITIHAVPPISSHTLTVREGDF